MFKDLNVLKNSRGNILVLLALSMSLFLAVSALIVDMGLTLLAKEKLQHGLDAGALAGTGELAANPGNALAVAEKYLLENVPNVSGYNITEAANGIGLNLWGKQDVSYFFAPFFGFNRGVVDASASARLGAVTGIRGAAPLAVEQHNFVFGQPYTLKQSPRGFMFRNYLGSGNFGALALGGSGASRYEENLKQGFQEMLAVGDVVETQTGNISGATSRGINYRLQQCKHNPRCTPDYFQPGCPRILLVPVYKELGEVSGQVKQVEIVGFSAFFVTEVAGNGTDNEITGYFVETVAAGTTRDSARNFGLKTVRLAKGDE